MDIKEAEKLAYELLERHRLDHWTVNITNTKTMLGSCNCSKKVLSLSRHHIKHSPDGEVEDTIKHEIAHALANMLYAENVGHDKRWKAIAKIVGAIPKRASKQGPPHKYEVIDTRNKKVILKYHRKPRGWRNIPTSWTLVGDASSKGHLRLYEIKISEVTNPELKQDKNKPAWFIKKTLVKK
jgi:predicted SprT family Zn-dependent metalloprotease